MNAPGLPGPATAQAAPAALRTAWLHALAALGASILAILVVYRETALSMVGIWSRSDTFAHGFIVPPITLWLVWRLRPRVASLWPRADARCLPLLAGAGFVWLLGELAAVNALSQFALVALLALTVPAVLGFAIARHLAFPLAFLFFAVPFGEFAMPQLMEWTADFTVSGLRLSGIPVYREGLNFVIPSGHWSVVEACSGVRYLIASLTVGTLYAYLTFQSLKRRLIFVGVSILVPVLANWVRAYLIVLLGHLSGNKLAAGVDHLVYGWLFFGLVILSMFWLGARWREDEVAAVAPLPLPGDRRTAGYRPLAAALLVVLLAGLWPLVQWQAERADDAGSVRLASPEAPAGWTLSTAALADWEPVFANPDASLHQAFSRDGRRAGLYIAYYRNQDRQRKLVSSQNVLVRSDHPRWSKVADAARELPLDGRPLALRSSELAAGDGARLLVWQWHWINGHFTASDFHAKLLTAWLRLTGQGDDSATLIVYTDQREAGEGEATLAAFLRDARPALEAALLRTREAR